jgi:hypothetical protein
MMQQQSLYPEIELSEQKKRMFVGKSDRTLFKHKLLNWLLGKFVGPIAADGTNIPCVTPAEMIDLCAGDGYWCSENEIYPSPYLFMRHAQHLIGKKGKHECNLHLIEKSVATFQELKSNCQATPFDIEPKFYCQDAGLWQFPRMKSNQALMFNLDPNNASVIKSIVTDEFLNNLPLCTFGMITLGCNASGVGRAKREYREEWQQATQSLIDCTVSWHDTILVWFKNDSHKWAYILRVPKRWTSKTIRKIEALAKQTSPFAIGILSQQKQRRDFNQQLHVLFTTKRERNEL